MADHSCLPRKLPSFFPGPSTGLQRSALSVFHARPVLVLGKNGALAPKIWPHTIEKEVEMGQILYTGPGSQWNCRPGPVWRSGAQDSTVMDGQRELGYRPLSVESCTGLPTFGATLLFIFSFLVLPTKLERPVGALHFPLSMPLT